MGLKNKIISSVLVFGLAGTLSLSNTNSNTNLQKEENEIRSTLYKFSKCVEKSDDCTTNFFLDTEVHKKINCADDRPFDYASSVPWKDVYRESFKVIPQNIKILNYNKNDVSKIAYIKSVVKSRCECTNAPCDKLTFGRVMKSDGGCPEDNDGNMLPVMKDYNLNVIYKLIKFKEKYYIDQYY